MVTHWLTAGTGSSTQSDPVPPPQSSTPVCDDGADTT
jgi:hypothetical protein